MVVKTLDLSDAVPYHVGQFPPTQLDYGRLLGPLEDAAASLARYDAKIQGLVNSALLLAPLRRQDAVASSRMEGTISTIEDIYRLEAEDDDSTSKALLSARNDDIETYLYSAALRHAQEAIQNGTPIGEYLIRSTHQELLSVGRGATKRPGAYKVEQNYIGDDRSGKIYYVPIAPEHLAPAMAALVDYMNSDLVRPLIRTAVCHVEFEAIHPFEDGNGRIGRMLITLMLWKLGILSEPHFFVSGYFEQHKDEYIERMRAVSAGGDWTGWISFFLNAMHEQARVNIETADDIVRLYETMRVRFRETLNSQYFDLVLDFVFARPIFRNDRFVAGSGVPATTARNICRRLAEAGVLTMIEPGSGRRAALYAFEPLLKLLRV